MPEIYKDNNNTRATSARAVAAARPLAFDASAFHPLLSWRSILAGILVSFLTMAGLVGLGMAIGGIGLDDGATARNAGLFSGVWFLGSAVLSVFAGAYLAARVSRFRANRIGAAEGLVVAALFLGIFLYQSLMAMGWIGRTAGMAAGAAGGAAATRIESMMDNEVVHTIVEDAILDLDMKAEPKTIISGVATRLMQGNTQEATAYLARQTGIDQAEANQRIDQLRAEVNRAAVAAREATADALQASGWALLALVVFGAMAGAAGGALGSRSNFRRPLAFENETDGRYTAAS